MSVDTQERGTGLVERWRDRRDVSRPPRRPGAWRRAVLLWGVLVTLLAAGLVFLFFFSAAFVVQDVQVEGAKGELADSVVFEADIPQGRPLARVSETRLAERVLEGEKRVRSVSLDRRWPSTIVYEVQLREPALALRGGGTTWLADAGGVVYDSVEKASHNLPAVTVAEKPQDVSTGTVLGLVELWRLRPDPAELEGEISTPRLGSNGDVTIRIDQLTIRWGPPVEAEKKWKVVQALVGQDAIDPQGEIPQTIDVSIPGTPVVTGIPPAQG
ncbi:cell division protein FtsQ/DivIB [Ornithinimicrobium avium]|uniref:POTRA domain-containing protein n=1 Tax=Ornithinimicrobium avium TaxID=2283195 RepID=A0A345NKU9_9MICO|nr:FtsQ-type POTRA domain-containing protein [Ornithinimicrobium avium]AXH95657.1 hypothetical protein DV701_05555 [Ornithinimicrobium avium]